MAAGNPDNNDGSDIFWPGYVDATTNLILNLLFLLTILIIAVFMFALELGRAVGPQEANADAPAVVDVITENMDPIQENIVLKSEIERLKELLAAQKAQIDSAKAQTMLFEGTSRLAKPANGLDQVQANDFELIVRFKDDSVSFKPKERKRLLQALKPVAAKKKVLIYIEIPAGFSESKRMGFYRALAVRNLLIEMKVPTEKIDVSVVEGSSDANASVVKVRSR
jgi:hypothetical protein